MWSPSSKFSCSTCGWIIWI